MEAEFHKLLKPKFDAMRKIKRDKAKNRRLVRLSQAVLQDRIQKQIDRATKSRRGQNPKSPNNQRKKAW
jgi:hypothetical protein